MRRYEQHTAHARAGWDGGGTFLVGPFDLAVGGIDGVDAVLGLECDEGLAAVACTGKEVGGGPVGGTGLD